MQSVGQKKTKTFRESWNATITRVLNTSGANYKLILYIYIYIYCHRQTDCFVISRLFSVTRYVGCFKLGLKPAQLYVRLSIVPLSQQSTYVNSGIVRHYVVAFVCLHFALPDTRVLNSFEELCITLKTI